jgi:hypothetical protein
MPRPLPAYPSSSSAETAGSSIACHVPLQESR